MKGREIMIKTTIKITGMACTMCEAHINEAVRNAFSVKKVKSSHSKGETVILSEESLDEAALYYWRNDFCPIQEKRAFFLLEKIEKILSNWGSRHAGALLLQVFFMV